MTVRWPIIWFHPVPPATGLSQIWGGPTFTGIYWRLRCEPPVMVLVHGQILFDGSPSSRSGADKRRPGLLTLSCYDWLISSPRYFNLAIWQSTFLSMTLTLKWFSVDETRGPHIVPMGFQRLPYRIRPCFVAIFQTHRPISMVDTSNLGSSNFLVGHPLVRKNVLRHGTWRSQGPWK